MNKRLTNINEVCDYLKQHINIVDVISEVTPMERAGGDSFKALCCFHKEKTPSLVATPSKGLFICFGCKESGDIISFYKKAYHMSTVEAIYELAEKYGVDIKSFERDLTPEEKIIQEYQQVCKQLQERMTANLLNKVGSGYKRFEEREIYEDIIKEFGLGYTSSITDVATGIDPKYIEVLELDEPTRYEDALIYPLYDPYGNIVGFKTRPSWGGKTVDRYGRKYPKFMGTSQKFPLHSNNELYGFHIARKHIGKDGSLIVVEGQHDVLSMHQVNIKNVVGTDGTALNEPKLKQLVEFGVRQLIILYDGDNAGIEASVKVAEMSIKEDLGLTVKIAHTPIGYDPDELVRAGRVLEINEAVNEAVYGSQYIIDNIFENKDLSNVTVKLDIMKQVSPIVDSVSPLEKKFIISYLAQKLNVMEGMIEDTIRFNADRSKDVLLYNIDAEKIVLGQMIRDTDTRVEALTDLKMNDFYLGKHQVVYEILQYMTEQGIEVQIDTLNMVMNNRGYKQLLNNGAYFQDLYMAFGEYNNAYEDILDKSIRRKVIDESKRLIADMQNLKNKTAVTIETTIDNIESIIAGSDNSNMVTPESGANDFMARLHGNMKHAGEITGIKIGDNFKNLTSLVNGLQGKKLITISANQSVGKTTMVLNWLDEIAITQRLPWVHYTLEMSSEEIVNKMIGIRAGVSTQKIEKGNVTDEEYKRICDATADYYAGGLIVRDDLTTLEAISADIRKLLRSKKIRGASIDYIQLMQKERSFNKQRYEELGDISGALKNDIAKKFNIPVVILSQLSRSAIKADIAKAEDGAGSYKIAQDSDIYITLKEKSLEEIQEGGGIENGNLVMNLDKNRGGQADVLTDIYFQKDIQRMIEIID